MTEQELIASVLSGDTDAFATLVNTHQARVRIICLGYLFNASEADDAAQDIFIKAYERLSSFKGDAAFGTWISRIAANHCLDLIRAHKRHHTDSLEALSEQHGDALANLLKPESGERSLSAEDREVLGKVFAALPEEEREILLLREVEELSYDEIASNLRCSLDAVKGRLKRARQRLTEAGKKWLDTSIELKRL